MRTLIFARQWASLLLIKAVLSQYGENRGQALYDDWSIEIALFVMIVRLGGAVHDENWLPRTGRYSGSVHAVQTLSTISNMSGPIPFHLNIYVADGNVHDIYSRKEPDQEDIMLHQSQMITSGDHV
jgi:hypothetical protein